MSEFESFREVHRVTEYKNGEVFKTEKIGEGWFDVDFEQGRIFTTALSTSDPRSENLNIRKKESR